eukprot:6201116-Pyramimonas_sp.AAC.1
MGAPGFKGLWGGCPKLRFKTEFEYVRVGMRNTLQIRLWSAVGDGQCGGTALTLRGEVISDCDDATLQQMLRDAADPDTCSQNAGSGQGACFLR